MTRERDRSELSRYVDQHRTAVAPPDRPCPPQETQDQGGVVYKVASPNIVYARSTPGIGADAGACGVALVDAVVEIAVNRMRRMRAARWMCAARATWVVARSMH